MYVGFWCGRGKRIYTYYIVYETVKLKKRYNYINNNNSIYLRFLITITITNIA